MCTTVSFFKKAYFQRWLNREMIPATSFRYKYPPLRSSEFTENDHGLFEQSDNASYTYRVM